ncbi:MAG: oligosaccharide flippase family protein [Acidimicrobiales bacterium]
MTIQSRSRMSATGKRKNQSSAVASGLALIGAVVTTVANFGLAALVLIPGRDFAGVFFAATALITILGTASSLGTMTGLVYFLPQALEHNNPRSLLGVSLRPVVAFSVALGIAVFAAAPVLGGDSNVSSLRALSIVVPSLAISTNLTGASRGLGTMLPTVMINQILRPFLQLALIGGLFLIGDPSQLQVAVAWGAPIVLGTLVATWWVRLLGGFEGTGPRAVSSAEFWEYTRPRSLSTGMQIALERVDVIIIQALAGNAVAGVYGAVTRFATAGNFLAYSISQAISPNLRRAIKRDVSGEASTLMQQSTSWLVLAAWPYFLFVSTKSTFLSGLFGQELQQGSAALTIIAIGLLASSFAGPVDLGLMMSGFSKLALVGSALALGTDVVLNFALVPPMGINGAAIAWAAAVIVQNGFAAIFLKRRTGLQGAGEPSVRAALTSLAAVVPLGLILPDTLAGALATVGLGGIVFVVLVARQRRHFGLDALDPSRIRGRRQRQRV